MEIKDEIIQHFGEEVEKTINKFFTKVTKVLKNMDENESLDDYEFDIDSYVKSSVERFQTTITPILSKIKSKKTKAKKDPNAPKKPRSAYILFSSDNRADVKEENPDMITTDITKEIARLWREANSDVKEEYKEKAQEDKKRYEREMEDYNPPSDIEESSKKKKEMIKK
jgi:hypothetical protein